MRQTIENPLVYETSTKPLWVAELFDQSCNQLDHVDGDLALYQLINIHINP